MCERGYFNYFRGKKFFPTPITKQTLHSPASYFASVFSPWESTSCQGDTHRAPPALEQLLAPQCLNILNFYIVLKQFFCETELVGRAWASASTAALGS